MPRSISLFALITVLSPTLLLAQYPPHRFGAPGGTAESGLPPIRKQYEREYQRLIESRFNERAERTRVESADRAADRSFQRWTLGGLQRIEKAGERLGGGRQANRVAREYAQPGDRTNAMRSERERAVEYADLHEILAQRWEEVGPRLTPDQRKTVRDVFGDTKLLEQSEEYSQEWQQKWSAERPFGKGRQRDDRGTVADPRARLTNAIRARRAQISELRDQALERDDTTLLERADQMEQKLDRFLTHQQRVERRLVEVNRRRTDAAAVPDSPTFDPATPRPNAVPLTAERGGLIESPSTQLR